MPPLSLALSVFSSLLAQFTTLTEANPIPPSHNVARREAHRDVLSGANFPDPTLLDFGSTTYVFGTGDGAGHQIPLTSNPAFDDPSGWSAVTDAFPTQYVPAFGDDGWAVPGTIWAPDVVRLVSSSLLKLLRRNSYADLLIRRTTLSYCIMLPHSSPIQQSTVSA
jgi:hypothetical protein